MTSPVFGMHQHPRPAPRSATAAANLQTNPARTNNQREETASRASSRQSLSSSGKSNSSDSARPEDTASAQSPERQRLNLIIQVSLCPSCSIRLAYVWQRFFSKAALIVISSRVTLPPAHNREGDIRLEKWVRGILCVHPFRY